VPGTRYRIQRVYIVPYNTLASGLRQPISAGVRERSAGALLDCAIARAVG
jgi:hypothetical protein